VVRVGAGLANIAIGRGWGIKVATPLADKVDGRGGGRPIRASRDES
jgi:hypothetical protein